MENTAKKAYSEILKVLKKHKEVCIFDIDNLERMANVHLFGLELKEKYGLNIDPKKVNSLDVNTFGEYKKICWFGEKYNRKISWSVDGRQPKDELLFTFIFGDGNVFDKDYPVDFFQKFWMELKTYKPDYTDEANRCLYWNINNAKEMFNAFDGILKKYHELNNADIKKRRIAKMEKDLELLKQK